MINPKTKTRRKVRKVINQEPKKISKDNTKKLSKDNINGILEGYYFAPKSKLQTINTLMLGGLTRQRAKQEVNKYWEQQKEESDLKINDPTGLKTQLYHSLMSVAADSRQSGQLNNTIKSIQLINEQYLTTDDDDVEDEFENKSEEEIDYFIKNEEWPNE